LLGVMNSRIFDWYARKFIETQMNLFFVRAFPVPNFDSRPVVSRICELAISLTCTSDEFADWAAKVGADVRELSESQRDEAIVELDAQVAIAYGLSRPEIVRIMETFHETWDGEAYLTKLLPVFERLSKV